MGSGCDADAVSSAARFTFGNQSLQGGIDFIPAILFTRGSMETYNSDEIKKIPRVALPSIMDIKYVRFTILRSCPVVVGEEVATWLLDPSSRSTFSAP